MTGEEWLARNAQLARDTHQKTAAARRAAATSAETVSSESAAPRQKLAGQLLQQQLQLLTVESQEADSALLTKLLRTCLVTVGLMPILTDGAGNKPDSSAEDLVVGKHSKPSKDMSALVLNDSRGMGLCQRRGNCCIIGSHCLLCTVAKPVLLGAVKLHQLLEIRRRGHARQC